MHFDDRLATVLTAAPGGDRSARTQFRQLLDLLGSAPATPLSQAGYTRLAELGEMIPPAEQSHILREPGLRLRDARLVEVLSAGDPQPAAAALATARLRSEEWLAIIPRLPIVARGFLRHRRDLPMPVRDLLDRLGVQDRVLPEPAEARGAEDAPPPGDAAERNSEAEGIRALLRRIEAFREGRAAAPPAPRLPLGDGEEEDAGSRTSLESFEFTCTADFRIDWASAPHAAAAIGMRLGGPVAALDRAAAHATRLRQPLRAAPLMVDGGGPLTGDWRIDAEPVFAACGGHFIGYRGRIRRALFIEPEQSGDTPADRMRQLLHELRTPVNAVQGFAEIIQQQLFGPAPHEYRALAAGIAVDAAKLLAAFDEIDRLARLETGAAVIEEGESDLREIVTATLQRLEGVLAPRGAGFALDVDGSPFTVPLAREDLALTVWRVLASLAGALAPGERLALELASEGDSVHLIVDLPASIGAQTDPFAVPPPAQRPAISAGMFGTGFALRLARAEVAAAGGALSVADARIRIALPQLRPRTATRNAS